MEFSINNNLTYSAIENLLDLLKFHSLTPNNLPPSLYKLKKRYHDVNDNGIRQQFCSGCYNEIILREVCTRRSCQQNKAELCQLLTSKVH